MLLPTRWKAEGIPGIVIESRIAGLVPILSNHNYNKELVKNRVDGILLKDMQNAKELYLEVKKLCEDRELFNALRENSIRRSEEYYVESYIDSILDSLL